MRTFQGQIGKINIHTLPTILTWLDKHSVPFDEVIVGKPWCGFDGFYVDDRSIRPKEFKDLSYEEVKKLLGMS
jgi:capsule biosynthesis phosphatase